MAGDWNHGAMSPLPHLGMLTEILPRAVNQGPSFSPSFSGLPPSVKSVRLVKLPMWKIRLSTERSPVHKEKAILPFSELVC